MSGETAAPAPRSNRLAVAGVLVLSAAITFAHPSATRLHAWPWRGYTLVLWLIPCALLLLDLIRAERRAAPPRLAFAGLALLAGVVLVSAVCSPFRALSLPHVWPTFSGVALVLWLHGFVTYTPSGAGRVAKLLAGSAAVLVIGSFTLWWLLAGPSRWSVRNDFPFGHSNYTAGAIVLGTPWIAWAAMDQRGWRRVGSVCLLAVALLTLVTTGSRGGILALAGMVALSALWLVFRARWSRTRRFAVLAAALVLGAAAVFSNARLRDLALGRGWSEAARESNSQRSAMLVAGIELGSERPLLGWGPGSVPHAYPRVRGVLRGGVDNVLQLHNTPVQVWATSGAAGLFAMLLIMVAVVRRTPAAAMDRTGAAAACSLMGYAAFALTDHQIDIPFINWMAAANVALILACAPGRDSLRELYPRTRRLAALAIGLALLVPLATTARDLLARRAYAANDLEQAIAWMPADPYYHHRYASELMVARNRTPDAQERRTLAARAIDHLQASLAAGTQREYAHFNLGWLLLDADAARAAAHFRVAAQLAPTRGGVYLGLALAELGRGNRRAAVRALALETLNDPAFSTAPIWELPEFGPLRSDVIQELDTFAGQAADQRETIEQWVAWIRWWSSVQPSPRVPPGFSRASKAFAGATNQIDANQPLADPQPFRWARLYQAWLQRDWTFFTTEQEFAAALERRAARHRNDFYGFLRAGTEDEPALIHTMRRVRPGSGVLAFHPDGPPLVDAYVVQENRLHELVQELFPAKGSLPAPLLLDWLPPESNNSADATR